MSVKIKRVDFVTIYSSNLEASRAFYVDLLEFPIVREIPNEFFQIDVAGVPICVDLSRDRGQRNNIGLEVDDLSRTEAALREKGLTMHAGSTRDEKEKWISVKDPDGNELIFVSHRR